MRGAIAAALAWLRARAWIAGAFAVVAGVFAGLAGRRRRRPPAGPPPDVQAGKDLAGARLQAEKERAHAELERDRRRPLDDRLDDMLADARERERARQGD